MNESMLILVVGSEDSGRSETSAILRRAGFDTVEAHSVDSALALTENIDLAIVELPLAAELLPRLRERLAPALLPVLVLGNDQAQPLEWGADAVLQRPFDERDLLAWSRALLRLRSKFRRMFERQRELEELSRTDGLTGLLNYRRVQERLDEEFRRAQRHGDGLSLIMMDLDHFKVVNDRRGHPVGDQILRAVSRLIVSCVRGTDLSARYGGEEFAILLPQTELPGAVAVAERIWRGARLSPIEGEKVTVSIGVAYGPTARLGNPDLLLQAADEALYRAKREGRDQICCDRQELVPSLMPLHPIPSLGLTL